LGPGLGFGWDSGSSCGSSSGGGSGGSSSGGGNGGGKAIWEGEPTALAWADIYVLDFIINKARGAISIGGRGGSID